MAIASKPEINTVEIEGQRVALYPKEFEGEEVLSAMAMIPLEKIDVDAYQRVLDERRAAVLARKWQDVYSHNLMVSARKKGRYACIDGQHRIRAGAIRGIPALMCEVLIGLTPKQEAKIFDVVNRSRRPVHPLDLYKNRLYAEDPVVVDIDRIVHECGLHVNFQTKRSGSRGIVAVKALYTLYAWDVLEDALKTLAETWPEDAEAFDRLVLLAVGSLHFCYPDLDRARFKRELARESLRAMESDARQYGSKETLFMLAKYMLNAYNRGLSGNRLNARALEIPPVGAQPAGLNAQEDAEDA